DGSRVFPDKKRFNPTWPTSSPPPLSAIQFIHALACSNQFALATAREIEIFREHVAGVALVIAISVACSTTAAATSIEGVTPIAVFSRPRIVPVPHDPVPFRHEAGGHS